MFIGITSKNVLPEKRYHIKWYKQISITSKQIESYKVGYQNFLVWLHAVFTSNPMFGWAIGDILL